MSDTPSRPNDPLDEYFDRLDSAFAMLRASPRTPPAEPSSEVTRPAPSLIAEAFASLLALEEGEPGARPVRLTSTDCEPRITDALLDDVTRRIIERLAPDAVRAVVVEVVSEMAERLVRQEIDRIRTKQAESDRQ